MHGKTSFEKGRIVDRLRAVGTLCLFILASAFASAILMDIIVYPVALLAVRDRSVFNIIVAWSIWLGLAAALVYLFARRIHSLRRDGYTRGEIAKHMSLRPLKAAGALLSLLLVSTAVIAAIYVLFGYNYYFMYKLSN
ncbi:MAG TPA: hypothetical protein VLM75_11405 [Spirochaetota bacterium]|nr:hypothetical protein [Spirochaetota bacterium]